MTGVMSENLPVTVEQTFDTSIYQLWATLTDVNRMRQWFFSDIPDFKPEVGFATEFNVQSESRNFLHQWEVTEAEPRKRLSLKWKYGGYPGQSKVTFELFQENHLVRLRLTHKGWENFPQDIPEFKRESCLGGWQYFIQNSLYEWFNKKD